MWRNQVYAHKGQMSSVNLTQKRKGQVTGNFLVCYLVPWARHSNVRTDEKKNTRTGYSNCSDFRRITHKFVRIRVDPQELQHGTSSDNDLLGLFGTAEVAYKV